MEDFKGVGKIEGWFESDRKPFRITGEASGLASHHSLARLAVNPPNAILNYLYALLESEARLAIAALGLDSWPGFLAF